MYHTRVCICVCVCVPARATKTPIMHARAAYRPALEIFPARATAGCRRVYTVTYRDSSSTRLRMQCDFCTRIAVEKRWRVGLMMDSMALGGLEVLYTIF